MLTFTLLFWEADGVEYTKRLNFLHKAKRLKKWYRGKAHTIFMKISFSSSCFTYGSVILWLSFCCANRIINVTDERATSWWQWQQTDGTFWQTEVVANKVSFNKLCHSSWGHESKDRLIKDVWICCHFIHWDILEFSAWTEESKKRNVKEKK